MLELAGDIDGRRVLEIATGSGELFRQLRAANPSGFTTGVDLSPAMMAVVRRSLNGNAGGARYALHSCDARRLPFADASFETLVNCYMLDLLPRVDLSSTVAEFRRVIIPGGRLLLALPSQSSAGFNFFYRLGGPGEFHNFFFQ